MDKSKLDKEIKVLGILGLIGGILFYIGQPVSVFWQFMSFIALGLILVHLRAMHEEIVGLHQIIKELKDSGEE